MEQSYKNKLAVKEVVKSKARIVSFNHFFCSSSNPLAKIIDIGKKVKSNSPPFLCFESTTRKSVTNKLNIIKIQFPLKVLFTAKALGVFNNNEIVTKKRTRKMP
ncbi:hypothetical protein PL373_06350 [Tenacibaculum maritimum]|nr:hypothetical protein [Tenacibaculum maritimum]